MFGLVTGLVKGVVDTVDTLAGSIDDVLFGTGDTPPAALRDIKTMRAAGYPDDVIASYLKSKYL